MCQIDFWCFIGFFLPYEATFELQNFFPLLSLWVTFVLFIEVHEYLSLFSNLCSTYPFIPVWTHFAVLDIECNLCELQA